LQEFYSGQLIDRLIPGKLAGDTLKRVTAVVNSTWMMGGLWGNQRNWNQIKSGTIHWNNANNETEWVLVPGDGKTNVRVTKTSMSIFSSTTKNSDFSIYVYAKDLSDDNFSAQSWKFPKMTLNIQSSLTRSYRKITDSNVLNEECAISEEYPAVMKITFQIPSSWNLKDPLLEIIPIK